MPKKNELKTPRSKVKDALRRLFLRSRERGYAIKRDHYACQCCGIRQSKAKGREVTVEVHHIDGVDNWGQIIDQVYQFILCHPDGLITLCKDCHEKQHEPTSKT